MTPNTSAALRSRDPRLDAVLAGLRSSPRTLAATWFYDHRGSELFERITELPEYYLTRDERALLSAWMPPLIARMRPATMVELGAGSAEKTRVILDAMREHGGETYVPVDVSAEFLNDTARRIRAEYPALKVRPMAADFTADFYLPRGLPRPILVAFLGSTIGNFEDHEAISLLSRVRGSMRSHDRLLLGADLRKDPVVLEAAYDDSQGVTAEFNRNSLRVVNRELGTDFAPDTFDHVARYDREKHRIEMHLVARSVQEVTFAAGERLRIEAGESIRTEISCKYDRRAVMRMFAGAGFGLEAWCTNAAGSFALALGAPAT